MDAPKVTSKAKLAGEKLRNRAALAIGFLGVGLVGIAIGRASTSSDASGSTPRAPGPVGSTSGAPSAAASAPKRQVFDVEENPNAHGGVPLRQMDKDIFAEITAATLERERMKDVFPERPYRVQFIGSIPDRHIAMVMIDTNRDGKFDERWEIREGEVNRTVFEEAAVGGKPLKSNLRHGRWQLH